MNKEHEWVPYSRILKTLPLQQFIIIINKNYNLGVSAISNGKVSLEPDSPLFENFTGRLLPNLFNDVEVYENFKTTASMLWGGEITFKQLLYKNYETPQGGLSLRIPLIKGLRQSLGLGLREAKDIVDASIDRWLALPELDKIDQTPVEELPLLIGSFHYPYSEQYLEQKLGGK